MAIHKASVLLYRCNLTPCQCTGVETCYLLETREVMLASKFALISRFFVWHVSINFFNMSFTRPDAESPGTMRQMKKSFRIPKWTCDSLTLLQRHHSNKGQFKTFPIYYFLDCIGKDPWSKSDLTPGSASNTEPECSANITEAWWCTDFSSLDQVFSQIFWVAHETAINSVVAQLLVFVYRCRITESCTKN